MSQLLSNPATLAIMSGMAFLVVGMIARYWYLAHRAGLEAALKQEMIQQGRSAEEIVQVLQASRVKSQE